MHIYIYVCICIIPFIYIYIQKINKNLCVATSTTGAPPCEHTHLFSEALISHTRPSLLSSSPLWICYPIQASPSILDHPLAQTSLCSTLTLIILWIAATATPCKHCFLSLTGLWFLKPVSCSCSALPLHMDQYLTKIQPIHPELSILLRKEMKRKSRKWQRGQLYLVILQFLAFQSNSNLGVIMKTFVMQLKFIFSVLQIKEITLYNVSGPDSIIWRLPWNSTLCLWTASSIHIPKL